MYENDKKYSLSILKSIVILGVVLAIQVVLTLVIHFFKAELDSNLWSIISMLGIQTISYLVFIYFFYIRDKRSLNFKSVESASKGLVVSLALLLSIFATVVITPLVNYLPVPETLNETMEMLLEYPAVAFFIIVIFAPIFEEVIFRGIILNGLLNRYPKGLAIVVSSALFGAFHLNLQQFISATFIGLFAGVIYARSRSIRYVIIYHASYNFFVIVSGGLFELLKVDHVVYPIAGFITLGCALYLTSKFRPLVPFVSERGKLNLHIRDYPFEHDAEEVAESADKSDIISGYAKDEKVNKQ